jgi:integrase
LIFCARPAVDAALDAGACVPRLAAHQAAIAIDPQEDHAQALRGRVHGHGFRRAFRDWAADHGVEFELAEQCLAHAVGNSVTRAYLRTTMLER